MDAEAEAAASMLPITGEMPPAMWGDSNTSKPPVVTDVKAFLDTQTGKEAYALWKQGKLTDRHIGAKFGYGVLGGFYGQKDWECGIFDGEPASEADPEREGCELEVVEAGDAEAVLEGGQDGAAAALPRAASLTASSGSLPSTSPPESDASNADRSSGILAGTRQTWRKGPAKKKT